MNQTTRGESEPMEIWREEVVASSNENQEISDLKFNSRRVR